MSRLFLAGLMGLLCGSDSSGRSYTDGQRARARGRRRAAAWAMAIFRSASIRRAIESSFALAKGMCGIAASTTRMIPQPPTIQEIAHGIEVERWKCSPYGDGEPWRSTAPTIRSG